MPRPALSHNQGNSRQPLNPPTLMGLALEGREPVLHTEIHLTPPEFLCHFTICLIGLKQDYV